MRLAPFFNMVRKVFSLVGTFLRTGINWVLGGTAYLVGIGLVSIVGRLVGKKFLELKIERSRNSYWQRSNGAASVEDYYRQF